MTAARLVAQTGPEQGRAVVVDGQEIRHRPRLGLSAPARVSRPSVATMRSSSAAAAGWS